MDKLHSIKQLLEQGRIEEALKELRIFFETTSAPTLQNNFTVLSSRYHYLKQDEIKGIIDDPTRRQERAQIINSFSELLSNLEKIVPPPTPTTVTATPKNGRLLHNIPPDMVRGEKCHCLVRIAENDDLLLEGLDPNRAVSISTIRLKRIIGVQILKEDNEAFEISTNNSERQYLEDGLATEWHFDIKPLKEGCHKLLLKVSGYEKIGKDQVPREAIIEKEIHVDILEKATILPHSTIWEDTGLSFDATKETKNNLFTAWFPKKALSFLATAALAAVIMIAIFEPESLRKFANPDNPATPISPKTPESIIVKLHTCAALSTPSVFIANSKDSRAFTPVYNGDKNHWECAVPLSYLEGTVKLTVKDSKTGFNITQFMNGADFKEPIEINCKAVTPNFHSIILKTQEPFANKPYKVDLDGVMLTPSDYTALSPNTLKINNIKLGVHGFMVTIDKSFSCSLEKNITRYDSLITLLCAPSNYVDTTKKRGSLRLNLIDNQKNSIAKINSLAIDGDVMLSTAYTYEGNNIVLIHADLEQNKNYRFNVDYTFDKLNCSGHNDSVSIGRYCKIIDVNCTCIIIPVPTVMGGEDTEKPPTPKPPKPPKPPVKVKPIPYWVRFKIDEKWKALAKKNNYVLVVKHNESTYPISFQDLQSGDTWQLEYDKPTLSVKALKGNYDQHIQLFLKAQNKEGAQKLYKIGDYWGKKSDKIIGEIIIDCPFRD